MLANKLFPSLHGKWLTTPIDLSVEADKLPSEGENPALNPEWCAAKMAEFHKAMGVDYSFGGWMEDRTKLWRNHYFDKNTVIHLGVDYYVPEGTWVQLPKPGRLILTEQDPDRNGGWGGRQVFQIGEFFVIFAHMCNMYGQVGRNFNEGFMIGQIAAPELNGGWFPHLHVQCCRTYSSTTDGYSSTRRENDFPDPEVIFS